MNTQRNNSAVFPVDLRQTYIGHRTQPQFLVAICVLLRICSESRLRSFRYCCPLVALIGTSVQTSLRLPDISHRQTDRQTDGENEFDSRVIRLDNVVLCVTVPTAHCQYVRWLQLLSDVHILRYRLWMSLQFSHPVFIKNKNKICLVYLECH